MIERRRLPRLQIRCAVSLWKPSDGTFIRTVTDNLNSDGFSCLASKSYQPGDELQAILEVTLRIGNGRRKADLALQCRVEVVRTGGCHSGVACRITDYMVIPRPEA
jgi:hypothetical protein